MLGKHLFNQDRRITLRKNSSKRTSQFITEALAIDSTNVQEANTLAFMSRAMVMATLPHSEPDELIFTRKNGRYTLTMSANPLYGLPYGSIPRMLLAWMTTVAVSTKCPELELGKTFSAFLKKLNLRHNGGKRGTAKGVREQMMRLLTCHISCVYFDKKSGVCEGEQYYISKSFKFWWNPIKENQDKIFTSSKIVLAKDFFEELLQCPIPINFSALDHLRKSPLQMDIYIWLTYRFSFLKSETFIPWKLLKNQFGSDYANDGQGLRNFKKKFIQALKKVWIVYPSANATPNENGLILSQSDTHIRKKIKENNPVDN